MGQGLRLFLSRWKQAGVTLHRRCDEYSSVDVPVFSPYGGWCTSGRVADIVRTQVDHG
jgi:hypothetical protein